MGKPAPTRIPRVPSVPRPICRWPSSPLCKRPTSEAYTEILALDFLAYGRKASILNCAVVGPDICPYFHVVTSQDYLPGHTVFRTNEGRDVASVEWMPNGGGACVELHDKSLEKQLVSVWLGVSRDARLVFLDSFEMNLNLCLSNTIQLSNDVRTRPVLCVGPAELVHLCKLSSVSELHENLRFGTGSCMSGTQHSPPTTSRSCSPGSPRKTTW
jgi:hypothetical protein